MRVGVDVRCYRLKEVGERDVCILRSRSILDNVHVWEAFARSSEKIILSARL